MSVESGWHLKDRVITFTSIAVNKSHLLGRGAFSEVFQASWDGRPCAAKQVPSQCNHELTRVKNSSGPPLDHQHSGSTKMATDSAIMQGPLLDHPGNVKMADIIDESQIDPEITKTAQG